MATEREQTKITPPVVRSQTRPPTALELLKATYETVVSAFTWFDEHQEDIKAYASRAQRHSEEGPWAYLLKRMPVFTAMGVALVLEARSHVGDMVDDSAAEMLESGLTEAELIRELQEAVAAAGLGEPHRDQLHEGLRYLGERKYHLAVPMLINPLEGAFWGLAKERGLIARNAKGQWHATDKTSTPGKWVRGVDGVFGLQELGLDTRFGEFLDGLAYGTSGNDYRHGTAAAGWRIRALCLEVSLAGLLEMLGHFDVDTQLRAGFGRDDERKQAEKRESGARAA